ncbi:MAG: alpha/beta hydrolase [Bacteroidetes bacterium]|nr:alpha/beta hydrolase [Bacteroidota bacterium]
MEKIIFNRKNIFYNVEGKGDTIVLLHGFMESSKIWKDFVSVLSKAFRVITIDLPGHGKSDNLGDINSMEMIAGAVHKVLRHLGVKKCVMIGHSMGGYATLSFASKYPSFLKGFGLFHSHPFADTPDGKTNRNRMIQLVKKDKLNFITQFIPDLFAPENQDKFRKDIEKFIARAGKMTPESVIASQKGMKVRKDLSLIVANAKVPVLFILGLKDLKLPADRLWEMVTLPEYAEVHILREAGHMGYIEAPLECVQAIYCFARQTL